MNWRLSQLDRYRLVSNSDAHSPAKLGREATTFDTDVDYFAIRRALETGDGYVGTVEFFPEEGKYHADGHRKCNVRQSPAETQANGGRCLVCGDPTTSACCTAWKRWRIVVKTRCGRPRRRARYRAWCRSPK